MTDLVTQARCGHCRKVLPPASAGRPAKFCGPACKQAAYRRRKHERPQSTQCVQCKKQFTPPGRGRPAIYCSSACRRAAHLGNKLYETALRAVLYYKTAAVTTDGDDLASSLVAAQQAVGGKGLPNERELKRIEKGAWEKALRRIHYLS
jgi:hypothetical protein